MYLRAYVRTYVRTYHAAGRHILIRQFILRIRTSGLGFFASGPRPTGTVVVGVVLRIVVGVVLCIVVDVGLCFVVGVVLRIVAVLRNVVGVVLRLLQNAEHQVSTKRACRHFIAPNLRATPTVHHVSSNVEPTFTKSQFLNSL